MHDGLGLHRGCRETDSGAWLLNQGAAKLGGEDVIVKVEQSERFLEVVVQLLRLKDRDWQNDVWIYRLLNCALCASASRTINGLVGAYQDLRMHQVLRAADDGREHRFELHGVGSRGRREDLSGAS